MPTDTLNNIEDYVAVKKEQNEETEVVEEEQQEHEQEKNHHEEGNGEKFATEEASMEDDTAIVVNSDNKNNSDKNLNQLLVVDQDCHQDEALPDSVGDHDPPPLAHPSLNVDTTAADDANNIDVDVGADDEEDQAGPTLHFSFQQNTDEVHHMEEEEEEQQKQQQQKENENNNEEPSSAPIVTSAITNNESDNDNHKTSRTNDGTIGDGIVGVETTGTNNRKRPRLESMENDEHNHSDSTTTPTPTPTTTPTNKNRNDNNSGTPDNNDNNNNNSRDEEESLMKIVHEEVIDDPKTIADMKFIKDSTPQTELELALTNILHQKDQHILKLTTEIIKLKGFISKRKQTYKRKRKDEGAPTRALSAYNIFVQDRFADLAKKNDDALKSTDTNAQMKRVPPATLVKSTGSDWKNISEKEKSEYEERAKADRKRYDGQMAKYHPPDKQINRKRNKTGYNMFFSAYVAKRKQTGEGVPSERGSVARYVGIAWKAIDAEERQYYEREADKHNGMNPVENNGKGDGDGDGNHHDGDDDDVGGINKGSLSSAAAVSAIQQQAQQQQQQQVQDPYAAHAAAAAAAHYAGHEAAAAAQAYAGDSRMHAAHHGYYYGQPHPATHGYHYDYSEYYKQHANQQQQQQQSQSNRQQQQQYQYPQQAYGEYK